MANKLSELDTLVSEATERKLAPDARPASDTSPEATNRSRSVAIKRAELERLTTRLSQLKEENTSTIDHLNNERVALSNEQKQLEEAMALVSKVNIR
ncbi:hypothetical protein GGI12_006051 [Dipsacomyces acuminosporus]|nr:hypothetical protein GGI12_006051 [Dipsacomyces acuminosporus]